MITKVQLKNQNITPFGGISYVETQFYKSGLAQQIDNHLGKRTKTGTGYSNADCIKALALSNLCGGECLEDIHRLRHDPSIGGRSKMPSPDTLARALQALSVENQEVENPKNGKIVLHNFAHELNCLLLDTGILLGRIPQEPLTLDFDHEFTPTKKYDTVFSYKHERGYFPGVAAIGNCIVSVENRMANASPNFAQDQQLERIFSRLTSRGIVVENFRADNASYCKDTLKTVIKHTKNFYIRARSPRSEYNLDDPNIPWKPVEINFIKYEVASVEFELIRGVKHRLVLKRQEEPPQDASMKSCFKEDKRYTHRCILTNNWELSEKQVIELYNARGESERLFDVMNNDFGWAHQPFSFMKQNTVFLIIKAIIHNFYHYLLHRISHHIPALKPTSRLKNFIYHFIAVPAKWVKGGRRWILNLYTQQSYYLKIYSS